MHDTMSYWLARVLRDTRERHAMSRSAIARTIGCSEMTIVRLEAGASYPAKLDAYVRGYAHVAGLDPRELWAKAIGDWMADAPELTPAGAPDAQPIPDAAALFRRLLELEETVKRFQPPGPPKNGDSPWADLAADAARERLDATAPEPDPRAARRKGRRGSSRA